MKPLFLTAILFVSSFAFSQGVRWPSVPTGITTTSGSGLPFVVAVPNAQLNWCFYPANAVPCTNYAPTYTSLSLATACPANAPIVLDGSSTCQGTTDNSGNVGIYTALPTAAPYAYQYTLTVNGVSSGPFTVTYTQQVLTALPNPANFPGGATFGGPVTAPAPFTINNGLSVVGFTPDSICLAPPNSPFDWYCDLNGDPVWNASGTLNQKFLLARYFLPGTQQAGQGFLYTPAGDLALAGPIFSHPGIVLSIPADTTHTNAYAVCPAGLATPQTLTPGQTEYFTATTPNNAASTLNWCASGVKNVTKNGTSALVAGDIPATPGFACVTWDGTEWEDTCPAAATGTGNVTISGTPTTGQISIWATAAAIKGVTMSQDCTMTNTGVITCTKTNNNAFTAFATQAIPCLVSQGCTNATTAAQALINLFPTATRVGDVIYCSAFSSGACTAWTLLAGNTGATGWLQENASGVAGWAATPSGTVALQVKGQTTVGDLTSSTLNTSNDFIRVSTYCKSNTSCNPGGGITNEGQAIAAIETAVNGSVSIIDDMCGTQYWSSQPFSKPGDFYDFHNCPNSNPHIIKIDGVSTITTPGGFHFHGMGAGGQAYPAAVINTFLSACNPALDTCPNGGMVYQSGTITSTTVSGSEMQVNITSNPFTTCAANNAVCSTATQQNAMQQYRRGCIVGSSIVNNNGCWLYDTTVTYNGNQQFKFWVVSGVTTACSTTCGTLVLDYDLISVGKGGGTPTVYHSTWENFQLDCNYLPGCEGFSIGQGEEGTGVFNTQVWNAPVGYGRIDTSNAYGGGSTGAANSVSGGPWAGNIANTTCNIAGGCSCQQPLTASVTYTNSGHTVTWVSGAQFPYNLQNFTLSGVTCTVSGCSGGASGAFVVSANGVNASGLTLTYTGTASPASGSATATLYNAGMTACAANATPGLAPVGTFMGCGMGGDGSSVATGQPIVALGGDPCFNPNVVGFGLTGGTGNQGSGLVEGHTTVSYSDKSVGGGSGIPQFKGKGAAQGVPYLVIGAHGGFLDTHTEYLNVGAQICGNSALNATWQEAYAANSIPTNGVSFLGGFWNTNGGSGVGVDIGQSGAGATCTEILFQGLNIGNGTGTTLSDNINGTTCTDSTISYEVGNAANPVLKNSCSTGGLTSASTVATFSQALPSGSPIASGACSTVTPISVPAITSANISKMNITADFNADVTGVTGYNPATGVLTVYKWLSVGNINFKLCNLTGSSITPSAATLVGAVRQ